MLAEIDNIQASIPEARPAKPAERTWVQHFFPGVKLAEEETVALQHVEAMFQALHERSVQAAADPGSKEPFAECQADAANGDTMSVDTPLSAPVEPSLQEQRDAEDAVVRSAFNHGSAAPEAVPRANDSAYSNLCDASPHTGLVGSTHACTPPV